MLSNTLLSLVFVVTIITSFTNAFMFRPHVKSLQLSPRRSNGQIIYLQVHETSRIQDDAVSLFLASENISFGTTITAFLLLSMVAAFVYANAVYTPEIMENSTKMRLQAREIDLKKLVDAIEQHQAENRDLEELRRPLEESFGVTIEEYVTNVEKKKSELTSADESLAQLLKPICRKLY